MMIPGFYAVCEPHLPHQRCRSGVLVAGLTPAFSAGASATADAEQGGRRLTARYAITPEDPGALVHAVRGVGKGWRLKGTSAAAYVPRSCVRAQEVNTRRYLSIPASLEVRSNMFLKRCLEAGVPSSTMCSCDGRVFQLKALCEEAKAPFRFDPRIFHRNDLAWGLIAFAELQASKWDNAYGQKSQLTAVVSFGPQALQEAPDEGSGQCDVKIDAKP